MWTITKELFKTLARGALLNGRWEIPSQEGFRFVARSPTQSISLFCRTESYGEWRIQDLVREASARPLEDGTLSVLLSLREWR